MRCRVRRAGQPTKGLMAVRTTMPPRARKATQLNTSSQVDSVEATYKPRQYRLEQRGIAVNSKVATTAAISNAP